MLCIDDIHAFWRDLGSNPSVKKVKYLFYRFSFGFELFLFTKCLQIVYVFLITDIKIFDRIIENEYFFSYFKNLF